MFAKITPEKAGVASCRVQEYIEYLERRGLVMHSVLLAKGEDLFCEAYWKPFDKDFCHRMYSQTKSYVAIAIGLLVEDGLLSLDDTMASYFPELCERELPEWLAALTIREMLMMRTTGGGVNWFASPDPDRTHSYLNDVNPQRPSGTLWMYDSAGSQVLSSLVEKLSGKSLFDFLNDRIFRHLGTFKTAEILKTRNGASWGDSALVCTSRDMLSFARFLMNGGVWDGKRLMNEAYIKEATSRQTDNFRLGFAGHTSYGYGYQIWIYEQGYGFNGMGCQFTICVPETDMIFVCTADNQGNAAAGAMIINGFFDYIVRPSVAGELPPNPEGCRALEALCGKLDLATACGEPTSSFIEQLNGVTYIANQNPTGISKFSFHFAEDGTGEFRYTNAQGDKVLSFGLGKNVYGLFPQFGYSDGNGGTVTTNGFRYRCAASAAFGEEKVMHLRVQIIDRYFGNLTMTFAFRDEYVTVQCLKFAENFLGEYQGNFVAKRADA